jgi:hypothetical protein
MKTSIRPITSAVILFCVSAPVFAGGSIQHFGNSIDHSAQAIAHSTVGGLKLVSGAIAIPLILGGEIGKVSGEIGATLWDEANTTLPITEEVITAGPTPAEAMSKEEEK